MSNVIESQGGAEMRQLAAAVQLPPEMMLLKMENESIMAIARTQPRDPMAIVAKLQQLIDAYPAAADEAIYSKPVGTVVEVICGQCAIRYEVAVVANDTACPACGSTAHKSQRKIKKFAEGLSIRAAESIRSIYGYTRLATTAEEIADGKVRLTGVLVDYAAGNLTSDERIVTPWYRSKQGSMVRTPEDRFLNVVVKAEKSKLRRDVILDSVPNIVKACFRDACERKMLELIAPEVVEQKILPAFAEYGISAEALDRIVGRPRALGWREVERLELRKILNALRNDETTARELLDGLETEPHKPKVGEGVTMDDLTRKADTATAAEGQDTPSKAAEAAATDKPAKAAAGPSAEAAAIVDEFLTGLKDETSVEALAKTWIPQIAGLAIDAGAKTKLRNRVEMRMAVLTGAGKTQAPAAAATRSARGRGKAGQGEMFEKGQHPE
jgi:hypothetical protein